MTDFRLPYFYNLAAAAIIGIFLAKRLENLFRSGDPDPMTLLVAFLTLLPAGTATVFFTRRYKAHYDLSVREGLFILVIVQILTGLIPFFLR